jgi:hypothetical protein
MNRDSINLDAMAGRPAVFASIRVRQKLPQHQLWKPDSNQFLRANLPSRHPILRIELKQILAGKVVSGDSLAIEFPKLVKQWEDETSFHSSLGEIFTNEAYQRIMAMGRDALPMILSELRKKPGHWFYALEKIVGKDVAEGAKNYAEARAMWLEWGYKNNYI